MESRMMELMEAIQESEGQAERRVLTLLGGRYISEKALVIDGKIVWESRKNGYFHGYTDEIKNIQKVESPILEMRKYSAIHWDRKNRL